MSLLRAAAVPIPGLVAPAFAATLPADPLERECGLQRTRVDLREPTGVDVAHRGRGHQVRKPFQVDFAARGMGQTGTALDLPPGRYPLRLRFVDGKTRRDLRPAHASTAQVDGPERL
ncbi:MAG: hypothetical protein Fur0014_20150 [Rubrivivax sp.]